MNRIYNLNVRKISNLITIIVAVATFTLTLTSCGITETTSCEIRETLVERQRRAVPTVELAAKKISNLLVKEIAPNTGRDEGYYYNYSNIQFNQLDDAIIVPIQFYWTAKEFQLFSSRLYCTTTGTLTIIKGSAWFTPQEYNKNLEIIAGRNWYNKDYSVTLDYTRRLY